MPSDRADWAGGPWIPGWTTDAPRAHSEQDQHECSPPPEQPDSGARSRQPWSPRWARSQFGQGPAQDDNTNRWQPPSGQQRNPQDGSSSTQRGGHAQNFGDKEDGASWPGARPKHPNWWSYENRERVFGPPDGAEAEAEPQRPQQQRSHHFPQQPSHFHQQFPHHFPQSSPQEPPQRPPDPCIPSEAGDGSQQPEEHRSRMGRHWAGALVGAGIYGFYQIVESITPPGWM